MTEDDGSNMNPEGWKPGDRLQHTIFGKGTVREVNAHRYGGSIVINFDDHGSKELQLSFAAGKLARIPRRGQQEAT